MVHLQVVLQKMVEYSLYAKRSKCQFGQSTIEYLGHILTKDGVSTDPNKVQIMKEWPIPKNLKQLKGFLGLTGYYRRFVRSYGETSRPLTNLLKKNAFSWSDQTTVSFNRLKEDMVIALVLALPDYSLPFVLETDASAHRCGFDAAGQASNIFK